MLAVLVVMLTVLGGSPAVRGQGRAQPTPHDEVAVAIPGVIAGGEKVEMLSANIVRGDGVIGLFDGSAAIIEQGTGLVQRISPDKQFSPIVTRPGTKAIGADREGNIYAILQNSFEIIYPPEHARVLAAGTDAYPLTGLNDFVVSTEGNIWLTDVGRYGQPAYVAPTKLHYLPKGGQIRIVADLQNTNGLPNGIVLSPDEATLYVSDSRNNSGMAFDVMSDGSVTNPRAFARHVISAEQAEHSRLQANGIGVDADGRLYVGMPNGVEVFTSRGVYLGKIPTTLKIQSVSFAGPNKEYLYMIAARGLWRAKMIAHGYMARAK